MVTAKLNIFNNKDEKLWIVKLGYFEGGLCEWG